MKLVGNIGLSASSESIYQTKFTRSRGNSTRHHPHRVSSRRNKENGSSGSFRKSNSSSIKKQSQNGNDKNANSNGNSSSNILKSNHNKSIEDGVRIHGSKSRIVSFGETPIVVKVHTSNSNLDVHHIAFVDQHDQASSTIKM